MGEVIQFEDRASFKAPPEHPEMSQEAVDIKGLERRLAVLSAQFQAYREEIKQSEHERVGRIKPAAQAGMHEAVPSMDAQLKKIGTHLEDVAGNILGSGLATLRQATANDETSVELDELEREYSAIHKTPLEIRAEARERLPEVQKEVAYLEKYFQLLESNPQFKQKEMSGPEGYFGEKTAAWEEDSRAKGERSSYAYIDGALKEFGSESKQEAA